MGIVERLRSVHPRPKTAPQLRFLAPAGANAARDELREIVANDMVILGSAETVANAILRLSSQLELKGVEMIFKLGAMPYDMVERSMGAFGEDAIPMIRRVLDRDAAANRATAA
jgi:hypothetical protein